MKINWQEKRVRRSVRRRVVVNPLRSRSKWARRGRGSAFFITAFCSVVVGAAWALVVGIARGICRLPQLWQLKRRRSRVIAQPVVTPTMFEPLATIPSIGFADIVGLADAKQQITDRMIAPFNHPQQAAHFAIPRGGGMLLVGPPGVGKTTLAKAVAHEVAAPFFHIKASDIVRQQLGVPEQRVAELFATMRHYTKAVLFIDDAEALLPSRSRNPSTVMRRVVAQFLVEWDGVASNATDAAVMIIAASNRPWDIDPAFRRPGRFDSVVYVGLPECDAREQLLAAVVRDKPLAIDVNVALWAARTEGFSGADITELVNRAAQSAFRRRIRTNEQTAITTGDFEQAIGQLAPSVTADDISRIRRFCATSLSP